MSSETIEEHDWYSDATATFGDRLAHAREAVGMGVEELATRLGVRAATLASWENDTSEPRANRLSMLAGILNVSMRWLMTGEGEGLPGLPSDMPEGDTAAVMAEMRQLQAEIVRCADRLGLLEKRLRIQGPQS